MQIWVDKLRVSSLRLFLMDRRLSRCRKVVYFEKGICHAFCGMVLRCFKPGIQIRLAEYSLGDVKDDRGRILRHRIEERLTDAVRLIQKDLERMRFLRRRPWSHFPHIWAVRYLVHEACSALRAPVRAIHLFEKLAEDSDFLLLCIPSFQNHLRAVGLLDSPNVVTYGGKVYTFVGACKLLATFASILLTSSVNLLFHLVVFRTLGRKQHNTDEPMVGVQYCWGHNLQGINDIYWLKNSGVSPRHVQFYFNRPDTPLTVAYINELKQLGYAKPIIPRRLSSPNGIRRFFASPLKSAKESRKSRSLRKEYVWHPPAVMYWEVAWLALVTVVSLGCSLAGPKGANLPWTGMCTFKMIYFVYFWRYFFQDNNIKIHMNHSGDRGNIHTVYTMAMHLTKGVNVRSNYSYTSICEIDFSREFHVYFSWGPKPRCDKDAEAIYSRCVISSGYIFDSLFQKEYAKKEMPSLTQCRLRAAVFDETFGKFANYSRDVVSQFYGALFLLAKTRGLGLYIKSKDYDKDALTEFSAGFSEAEASGNVVVLNNRLRPYQALHYADLAVCLGFNSAGIEAALYGKPTLYWVHDDSICEQLEVMPSSRLVFHDLEELTDLLCRALEDPSALHGFGDHSDVIDDIDPFRDGHAGKRIGNYINSYLKNIARLMDREESLAACNEEYCRLWGEDKVSCIPLDSLGVNSS